MGKKKKQPEPQEPPRTAFWRRRWFGHCLILLAVGTGVAAVDLLRRHINADLSSREAAAEARLSLPDIPAWITGDPFSLVRTAAQQSRSPAWVAAALASSAWVQRVRIEHVAGRWDVAVEFRRPVLCVPFGDMGCYVDADGVVLPADQATTASLQHCLVLEGAETAQPPIVGRPYPDPRLASIGPLAALLQPYRQRLRLLVLTLDRREEPLRCQLRTADGHLVSDVWFQPQDLQQCRDQLVKLLGGQS